MNSVGGVIGTNHRCEPDDGIFSPLFLFSRFVRY
jgi:hypothetical protein